LSSGPQATNDVEMAIFEAEPKSIQGLGRDDQIVLLFGRQRRREEVAPRGSILGGVVGCLGLELIGLLGTALQLYRRRGGLAPHVGLGGGVREFGRRW